MWLFSKDHHKSVKDHNFNFLLDSLGVLQLILRYLCTYIIVFFAGTNSVKKRLKIILHTEIRNASFNIILNGRRHILWALPAGADTVRVCYKEGIFSREEIEGKLRIISGYL